MHNLTIFPVISIISIFLLGFSTFNLFKRRSIVEILLGVSVWTFIILEIAKFSLVFELNFAQRILGLGFCLLMATFTSVEGCIFSKEVHFKSGRFFLDITKKFLTGQSMFFLCEIFLDFLQVKSIFRISAKNSTLEK